MNLAAALNLFGNTDESAPQGGPGGRLVATDGALLPLRSTDLSVEAGGGIARVVLTQRFVNPHREPLTVEYLLPLPSDGAVSGFRFHVGETLVVGEVDRKQRARERFAEAVAGGHTAALLEQDRTSLFSQKVGNIPPGEEIVAEITIDQPLAWLAEGAWELRFPTVVGPRYQGAAGRVADAGKVLVDLAEQGTGVKATLDLTIADKLGGAVESVSHRVASTQDGATTSVRFGRDRGVALDRDIVVRWPVAAPEVGADVLAARPADDVHEGDTFGLVTLVPPTPGRGHATNRDLIFLIDTSGSMGGRPLNQVKRVVSAMIDTLGPDDRVELIEFGSTPVRFAVEPLAATTTGKRAALKWLKNLRASGATEMHRALLEAMKPLRDESQRQVVLLTDGYIGFEQEIVDTLLTKLPAGARLHTVGVGSAVNRSLTQAAARAGRGTELIIGIDEDAERLAERLVANTTAPLVTDLVLEGADLIETAPLQLPDLYAGAPALIAARFGAAGQFVVRGRTADGPYEQRITVPELALGQGAQGVAALFSREKIEDLEMQIAARPKARQDLDASIENVGIAFQIASRLTSWIAVTEEATVDPDAAGRRERMPHEVVHGVSVEGLGLRSAVPMLAATVTSMTETGAMVMRSAPAPAQAPPPVQAPGGRPTMPIGREIRGRGKAGTKVKKARRSVSREEEESLAFGSGAVLDELAADEPSFELEASAEVNDLSEPLAQVAEHKGALRPHRSPGFAWVLFLLIVLAAIAYGLFHWLAADSSPMTDDAATGQEAAQEATPVE